MMADEEPEVEVEVEVEGELIDEPAYAEGSYVDDDVEGGGSGYKVEDIDAGAGDDDGFAMDMEEEEELAGTGDARKMLNPLDSMDGYTVLITLLVLNVLEFVSALSLIHI